MPGFEGIHELTSFLDVTANVAADIATRLADLRETGGLLPATVQALLLQRLRAQRIRGRQIVSEELPICLSNARRILHARIEILQRPDTAPHEEPIDHQEPWGLAPFPRAIELLIFLNKVKKVRDSARPLGAAMTQIYQSGMLDVVTAVTGITAMMNLVNNIRALPMIEAAAMRAQMERRANALTSLGKLFKTLEKVLPRELESQVLRRLVWLEVEVSEGLTAAAAATCRQLLEAVEALQRTVNALRTGNSRGIRRRIAIWRRRQSKAAAARKMAAQMYLAGCGGNVCIRTEMSIAQRRRHAATATAHLPLGVAAVHELRLDEWSRWRLGKQWEGAGGR